MEKITKLSSKVPGWKNKTGLPKVWRVIESRKKTGDGKTVKFSIQEIPEDRHEDVLDHMSKFFIRDEAICKHLNFGCDQAAIDDFFRLWRFALEKGNAVGAFVIDENNPRPLLAGANMTIVHTKDVEKEFEALKFNSERMSTLIHIMMRLSKEKDMRDVYNVDEYITAVGLSVDPEYRRQGIASQLLGARQEMGKAYNITATSTIFTSEPSQLIAAQANFDLLIETNYKDLKDDDGREYFPGIPVKSCKLMGKSLL